MLMEGLRALSTRVRLRRLGVQVTRLSSTAQEIGSDHEHPVRTRHSPEAVSRDDPSEKVGLGSLWAAIACFAVAAICGLLLLVIR